MIEEAALINDYLPLKQSEEETAYTSYLWHSFETLASGSDEVVPFSLTAFHLLFVLAVQHKVLRIREYYSTQYSEAFDKNPKVCHKNDRARVLAPTSVFDLSFVNEKFLMYLLGFSGLTVSNISKCKSFIDIRNNEFMHASGNIPKTPVEHIVNCLTQLEEIQSCFTIHNEKIAGTWANELTAEDDVMEFVDLRLFQSQLTRADFSSGSLGNLFGFCV